MSPTQKISLFGFYILKIKIGASSFFVPSHQGEAKQRSNLRADKRRQSISLPLVGRHKFAMQIWVGV